MGCIVLQMKRDLGVKRQDYCARTKVSSVSNSTQVPSYIYFHIKTIQYRESCH